MLTKIHYTAEVTNIGARTGSVRSSDGALDLQVRQPAALGGPSDSRYTNPEQLFAATYSACFAGALAANGKGKDMRDGTVTALVHIGSDETGGYGIGAELHISLPHLSAEDATEVVNIAHQSCPYSKAIRGNVDVKLVIVE
jgi:lipoyl-dependent peroxiredoxin